MRAIFSSSSEILLFVDSSTFSIGIFRVVIDTTKCSTQTTLNEKLTNSMMFTCTLRGWLARWLQLKSRSDWANVTHLLFVVVGTAVCDHFVMKSGSRCVRRMDDPNKYFLIGIEFHAIVTPLTITPVWRRYLKNLKLVKFNNVYKDYTGVIGSVGLVREAQFQISIRQNKMVWPLSVSTLLCGIFNFLIFKSKVKCYVLDVHMFLNYINSFELWAPLRKLIRPSN